MSGIFGGGSSDSSSGGSVDIGSLFGGGSSDGSSGLGGSDLGSMFSNLASDAFGGGSANPSTQAAQTVDAVQQATDPTGSIGATEAITGGQQPPQQQQNQNPQGQSGGQGQAGATAPQSAVDQLKKALTGLTQQQRQNPWQLGGSGPNTGQNASMLNRAGRIPTGQVPGAPANPADIPSGDAQQVAMNDNTAPPQGMDPAAATQAGLRTNAPDTGFRVPGQPANDNPAPGLPVPSQGGGVPATTGGGAAGGGGGAGIEGLPPPGNVGALAPPSGLAGLAQGGISPLWRAAIAAGGALEPSPAETGELTPGQRGMSYRPEDDPQASKTGDTPPAPQGDPGAKGSSAVGSTTRAPATGKPVETVDPRTKKPVDPNTGAPLPTKKSGEPPTKVPSGVTPDGHGPLMRDVSGMSHGVPPMLGQLAQMALPLIMQGLMGGMGGGGRRGRGFRGGGFRVGAHHFGGDRMWPYHHPQAGWKAFGHHPGGGWLPMHPNHAREFGLSPTAYADQGGGGGGGDIGSNPAVQSILAALGGGQGGQGQNRGQSGFGRPRGGGMQGGGAPQGPAGGDDAFKGSGLGSNPFISTLVGQESRGGQNIVSQTDRDSRGLTVAQGGNPNEISQGYFQIQNHPGGTWQTYGRQAGIDLSKYPSPRSAPLDVQWQVASRIPIGQWGPDTQSVLRQRGFNYSPNTPMGQVAQQFGGVNIAQPGKTPTGGTLSPNPQGNPSNANPYANTPAPTQIGPEGVAAQ